MELKQANVALRSFPRSSDMNSAHSLRTACASHDIRAPHHHNDYDSLDKGVQSE